MLPCDHPHSTDVLSTTTTSLLSVYPWSGSLCGLYLPPQLTAECGFNSIVPKVWVEPLNGVMPHSGFHVKWLGLWADIADGVSVQNLQVWGTGGVGLGGWGAVRGRA